MPGKGRATAPAPRAVSFLNLVSSFSYPCQFTYNLYPPQPHSFSLSSALRARLFSEIASSITYMQCSFAETAVTNSALITATSCSPNVGFDAPYRHSTRMQTPADTKRVEFREIKQFFAKISGAFPTSDTYSPLRGSKRARFHCSTDKAVAE